MLRKSLMAVLLLAVTALAACGGPKPAQGLLTEDEIGKLENLYLSDRDTALKGLGFSEKDLDTEGDGYEFLTSAGAYPLKSSRSIDSTNFRQILLTSVGSPEGLYGMYFQASFDTQEEAGAAREALISAVSELYGEPAYPDTQRWKAGEVTELALHQITGPGDNEGPYTLRLEYSVPAVVDGRRLSGEEIAERVRSVQEKQ